MPAVSAPLIDIIKNSDGTISLSLNTKGLKLLASLLVEDEASPFKLKLHKGKDFEFHWPKESELQTRVLEGTVETLYGTRAVRIGHVKRNTAGQLRDVVNVFVEHRPIVQFLSSDDGKKMASLASSVVRTQSSTSSNRASCRHRISGRPTSRSIRIGYTLKV